MIDVISYSNENLIVEIKYSVKNEYVEIRISNTRILLSDGGYKSVSLHHILKRKKQDFNYEKDYLEIMPKKIGLENSFRKLSILFEEYASNILREREWFSWDEVNQYTYPNKDSQIKTTDRKSVV